MNLKDALLCIDCDELFTVESSSCNTHCPKCASTVYVPISAWVPTWATFGRSEREMETVRAHTASAKKRKIQIIHAQPIAA